MGAGLSYNNVGVIGTPFKLSALTMAIAVATATQPRQEDEPHWLDAEEGPLVQRFDNFLNSWTDDTEFTIEHESSDALDLYCMTADSIPFSFRRIDDRYSLLFDNESETIQQSTFEFFVEQLKFLPL
ncbi:Uncharacterised protein [Acinetobacter lwoffii]|uniref:Uncharacterized protein n=1 Tax=Acinetobacter lwoffii NCTC 5866 = CIP 64.10 = NIPH 512 TaxID=981327 RepID=A0ABP2ZF21_ACILW|nr:hypothetical protein F995_02191 [Acinetobacter sp. CIP A162]ESJ96061.1 hypothetical protein P800_00883 [Acinetobacter lwoffii NCTC 5866 = CIP 64.10 = NIPH 512]QXB40426.1 hypothetical protein I6L23_14840 [Acinetobacter lwoffii]SUU30221.1 Uncharacterised protein [Acinetobacter lwoffii]VFQ38511.1 Uncharacterised protein [Acinetobacter lwoffii]